MSRPWITTWVMVETYMYVQAEDGSTWLVVSKGRRVGDETWTLRLRAPDGREVLVSKPPEHPVTILVPSHEDAEAMFVAAGMVDRVQRKFIRMEDYAQSDTKGARAALAGHLFHQHKISVSPTAHAENGSILDLLEAHALAHAKPQPNWLPHVHVPEGAL